MTNKTLATLCLTTLLFAACYSVDCPIENVVTCKYGFYTRDGGEQTAITLEDTLTITALGTDSVLINRLYNRTSFNLPMSYYRQTDTLVFRYNTPLGTAYDTVWVSKHNYEHFENPNCPTSMFHTVTAARSTRVFIDTIIVVNSNVNYASSENIQILFH